MTADERPGPGPLRILIVEDDPDAAGLLALLLRLDGHQVEVVGDGPAALQAVEARPPDVALLDLGLPGGLDGHEVARRIRRRRPARRPVLIALTGSEGRENRLRSYEAGIDLHLTKPVGIDEVRAFLARYQSVTSAKAETS